jgi:hypothetical protein
MHADNTAHLITAASQRHELTRSKAIRAVRELDAAGTTVTFESVARAAGVSRSWLFTQPDIRDEVLRLRNLGRPRTWDVGAGTPPQQRRLPAPPAAGHHRPQPGTGRGQSAAAPSARPSPPTAPRRRHPSRLLSVTTIPAFVHSGLAELAGVVRARPRLGTVPDLHGTGASAGATPRPSGASTGQAGKKVARWLRVVSGRQACCWPPDCSSWQRGAAARRRRLRVRRLRRRRRLPRLRPQV